MRAFAVASTLLLTLVFATTAVAAEYPFGVKFGVSAADWSGDLPDGIKKRPAYVIGAFVEVPMKSSLSAQAEILYGGKGPRHVQPNVFPRVETDFELTYVDIPLLIKFNWTFGASEPYLLAGPSINILMSAKQVVNGNATDIKDAIKSSDFGMVMGFGVNMKKVLLEARYSFSLSEANQEDIVIDDKTYQFKNGVSSIMFGVTF